MRSQPVPSLGIADQNFGTRIGHAEHQFLACPPCVKRNDNRTDHRSCEECYRPFGQVAHCQRHSVAFVHTQILQLRRKICHGSVPVRIGHPLVIKDHELTLAKGFGVLCKCSERWQCIFPHASGYALNLDGLHFERHTGRTQSGLDIVAAHCRPASWRGPFFARLDHICSLRKGRLVCLIILVMPF